jgi:hypothetical protein
MPKPLAPFGVLILLLAGCGAGEHAAAKAPVPPPPVICPLTGEQKPPGFPVDRAPVAVKIDNAPPARPQAGLESADVVYEELAEGGLTRFLAIYHCSDAADVGPVRSIRFVDADILGQYAPVLFAFSGGAAAVTTEVLGGEGIVNIGFSSTPAPYERRAGRRAPSDLFTSTDGLRAANSLQHRPEGGLLFGRAASSSSPAPPAEGSPSPSPPPGQRASFSFAPGGSTIEYVYDSEAGAYLRSQGTAAHLTAVGAQQRVVNVVVLKVAVRPGRIMDAAGNSSPETQLVGSGEAIVLNGGRASSARWEKGGREAPIRLLDDEGDPVALIPGNTWIHLLPSTRPVDIQ